MSKHPTERVRSVAEMQATSMQQSDKALRRMAAAEERLARLEGRLAEKDELISEFREAYGRQADTISAMSAVVKELESKIARGVDQVLTGLEGRISKIEEIKPLSRAQVRAEAAEAADIKLSTYLVLEYIEETREGLRGIDDRISALEAKPKRGRPKGSKNKPKAQPQGEQHFDKSGNDTALGCPEQQPEGESQ